MLYFSNKFSKIQRPLNLQYWWLEVSWFGQIVVFEADYNEIKLQKYSYDVISATSSPLRPQKFFQFGPLPIKISGYASGLGLIIWCSLKKAVLVLKKWFWSWSWSWPDRSWSWSWKIKWSRSCNLVVLLHHWLKLWLIEFCEYFFLLSMKFCFGQTSFSLLNSFATSWHAWVHLFESHFHMIEKYLSLVFFISIL